MSGGGTQNNIRKALGAIKDSTRVGLAKVNSDYKELDVAIVKATNHVERPAKEKYIQAIFSAVSATRPRADVAYCIHALARRLAKTCNWAVALKTLIVIHRALREVDPTFREELINFGRSRSHMLNLSHFKDDSSPNAWDYSAWVRTYALFLEERLECFRVLKYDIETERLRTRELDTVELLEQLPALQQLLSRLLACQPQGAAVYNFVIQLALSMVAGESIKIYNAISEGNTNLVDKFFEMQRHDAIRALEIFRRATQQAERLSEFYEVCKSLDLGRGERYIKIEQPPASFLTAMEEYVRDAPRTSIVRKEVVTEKIAAPNEVLALEYKKTQEDEKEKSASPPPPPPPPPPEPIKVQDAPPPATSDLLDISTTNPDATNLDEKNSLALAIVPVADSTTNGGSSSGFNVSNGTTGWELALVSAPSSNEGATTSSKLAGGLDKLTLDSLYDDAMRRSNQNVSYNPWEVGSMANPHTQPIAHDPFRASSIVAAPTGVQMAAFSHQQRGFMMQQQMMTAPMQQPQPLNPFMYQHGVGIPPYGTSMVPHVQSNNPYTGLI